MPDGATATSPLPLGPGALTATPGSPFVLAEPEWQAIRDYVVAAREVSFNGALIDPYAPGISELLEDEYSQWVNHVYPAILGLASDIAGFGSQCGVVYDQLQKTLPLFTGRSKFAPPQSLLELIGGIIARSVSSLAARSALLADSADEASGLIAAYLNRLEADQPIVLRALDAADVLTAVTFGSDLGGVDPLRDAVVETRRTLESVRDNVGAADHAMRLIFGACRAISSDLNDLNATIAQSGIATSFAQLNLEAARAEWITVAQQARDVVQNAPRI